LITLSDTESFAALVNRTFIHLPAGVPWELGYFDGFSGGSVAVLPIVDYEGATFKGQEYLGLYPVVDKGRYTNGQSDTFVTKQGGWLTLDSFRKGSTAWNHYS
jgi:hypothetical protein